MIDELIAGIVLFKNFILLTLARESSVPCSL